MHKLPKPHLYPLLPTWSAEFTRIRKQVAMLAGVRLLSREDGRGEHTIRRERPFRVMHLRRRLYACHWAGWKPAWLRPSRINTTLRGTPNELWGDVGPKWNGGRVP